MKQNSSIHIIIHLMANISALIFFLEFIIILICNLIENSYIYCYGRWIKIFSVAVFLERKTHMDGKSPNLMR
jgi:hypothetical protein